MRTFLIVAAVGAAALWAGVSAQQEMLPRPGPGSGVTPVAASQRGDWEVAVTNTPTVRVQNAVPVRAPSFVRPGTYRVTWPNGDEETVTISLASARRMTARGEVVEPSDDGWVEVRDGSRKRWINLTAARSIEEAR